MREELIWINEQKNREKVLTACAGVVLWTHVKRSTNQPRPKMGRRHNMFYVIEHRKNEGSGHFYIVQPYPDYNKSEGWTSRPHGKHESWSAAAASARSLASSHGRGFRELLGDPELGEETDVIFVGE